MRKHEVLSFAELTRVDPRHARRMSARPGTSFPIEVNPRLPARLARLDELANNLWYSWDRPTRALFARLNPALWQGVDHSPKAFLKRVDQRTLDEAAEDPVFLGGLNRVLSSYDTYHHETVHASRTGQLGAGELIAYFCAEFGFHESLPIYSGGLGILAGDHCKAASDLRLPFVGVGLLYRQGYFSQTIDGEGRQLAVYADADFDDLPVTPILREDGSALLVDIDFPDRLVKVRVWQVRVGVVTLYLLDTDVAGNSQSDRDIAHRLYGGDRTTRIEQEIVLGIGGVRVLAAIGVNPTVWHINEGHAAFLILERMRQLTTQGADIATALEAVAANTVFTTHTAVPAGHDHFGEEMIRHYFDRACRDLGVSGDGLLALGRSGDEPEFNMTALAVRGSRYQNGVSRIHGSVSSYIAANLWPQIDPGENPMTYVTNAVHVPTFLAQDWSEMFERYLGHGWTERLCDEKCWERIHAIPDQLFWSVRQSLKSQMLHLVRHRVGEQHARNHGSQSHLDRLLKLADPANPNVLTIGFARRFATYKRAALLFHDLGWLRQIVSDPERPVLFLFSGKAHPADQPGQDLIARVAEVARMPEFEGRILLVEGYDLRLARRLVSGCDVWLNNPVFPLEASGTSGMKAAINGAINLSVLDGWWGEGYDGRNGWAIKPASEALDEAPRAQEEARTLYEILQDQALPLYYDMNPQGYSPGWVQLSKRSMLSLLPRFNSSRMVGEYLARFYAPASRQWGVFSRDAFHGARELAAWKARIRAAWPGVGLRRMDSTARRVGFGDALKFELAVRLSGLAPSDVAVEVQFGRPPQEGYLGDGESLFLEHRGALDDTEQRYELEFTPRLCGRLEYRFRIYPRHPLLTHPFEMGLMVWL